MTKLISCAKKSNCKTKTTTNLAMSAFNLTMERRMFVSMKQTVDKILKEKDGWKEIKNTHYLNGTFRQLCDPVSLLDVLYPGASKEMLKDLPKTLRDVLLWINLQLDYNELSRKAAEVLNNVKAKGVASGNVMDSETENVLLPQIAQESLSKGIIDAVRVFNRKVSSTLAKTVSKIADPLSEKAGKNQLSVETIACLMDKKHAAQYNFFGSDWADYLRRDIERYVGVEKMTTVDFSGNVVTSSLSMDSSNSIHYMCWIEPDAYLLENYPALAESIEQIHTIPFEVNGKVAEVIR
jgi:hypothetical protein